MVGEAVGGWVSVGMLVLTVGTGGGVGGDVVAGGTTDPPLTSSNAYSL